MNSNTTDRAMRKEDNSPQGKIVTELLQVKFMKCRTLHFETTLFHAYEYVHFENFMKFKTLQFETTLYFMQVNL